MPLGMASGAIPDHRINASSFNATGWEPWRGRLNHKGGAGCWGPMFNRSGEYLQIDMGKVKIVSMIMTQGREGARQWVTAFEVAHSLDGQMWTKVVDHHEKVKVPDVCFRNTVDSNMSGKCRVQAS